MNGVAVTLEAAEEAEGEEADEEADQRQQDANPSDDIKEHVVHGVCVLKDGMKGNSQYHPVYCCFIHKKCFYCWHFDAPVLAMYGWVFKIKKKSVGQWQPFLLLFFNTTIFWGWCAFSKPSNELLQSKPQVADMNHKLSTVNQSKMPPYCFPLDRWNKVSRLLSRRWQRRAQQENDQTRRLWITFTVAFWEFSLKTVIYHHKWIWALKKKALGDNNCGLR